MRRPTGFILPTVVVAIVLVAMLAAAVQSAALRADRIARLGFAGEHALHSADAGIARRLHDWNARDFAAMDIGARDATTSVDAQGLTADVVVVRTNGLNAWIEASVRNTRDGNLLAAHRRVARFITIDNAPLPHSAAYSALGALRLDDPASLNGSDQPPPGWTTECNGIDASPDVTPLASTSLTGTAPLGSMVVGDSLAARALFDRHWNDWRARAAATDIVTAPVTLIPDDMSGHCAPGTGDPLRDASASTACIHEWGARLLTTSSGNSTPPVRITITGTSRFQGVLLIDGDLDITGDLRVDGLLIVRGALTSLPGRLTVHGSLLVRDEAGQGSRLGIASRVQYSRCAMHKALAATGIPTNSTYRGWFERP